MRASRSDGAANPTPAILMKVVFIHGWSVTHLSTYGGLPAALARRAADAGLDIEVDHLHLAKYVSFADEVTVEDIARGMEHAVRTEIMPRLRKGERFACVTHSTGGPVAREWIHRFYGDGLRRCPLSHLVMLAPANHGSALAQLGKGRLSRLKAWVVDGVEPGVGVLNWLELGSAASWALNESWLDHDCMSGRIYPFVLTGQRIDRAFYDNLNSYTAEEGSDGVVRVTSANLNYGLMRLQQEGEKLVIADERVTPPTAFGILPGLAHSGDEMGILRSVKVNDDGAHPTLKWLLRCLAVNKAADYRRVSRALEAVTVETQAVEREEETRKLFLVRRTFITSRYVMLVLRLHDDRGGTLRDYEVLFTAGPKYDPNHLPEGFFVDRQRNQRSPGTLTYYLDYDVIAAWAARPEVGDHFGVKVVARPNEGYAYYVAAEYRGSFSALRRHFQPNRTMMIDITLRRHVREGVFRLTQAINLNYHKGQKRNEDDFSRQDRGEDLPMDV
jgi:hypothetical protein